MPNHYRVFLSPQDREQFSSYEPALRKELSDYLLEHARAERLALTSRPAVEFMTDDRLGLGEFGIQAQLLSPPDDEVAEERRRRTPPPRRATSATPWSTPPTRRSASSTRSRLRPPARSWPAPGAATCSAAAAWCSGAAASATSWSTTPTCPAGTPSCARDGDGWSILDLGSTNGVKVNRRRVDQAGLHHGDRITVGVTDLDFELE